MELPKNGLELYSLIYEKDRELSFIHWSALRFSYAKFLVFFPLSEKELSVFNKLSDNSKLPYLTRRIVKLYKKNIGNSQLLNLFFDVKKDYSWVKKYHNPLTVKIESWELRDFDSDGTFYSYAKDILLAQKREVASVRTNNIKSLLTKITSSLVVELCQKSLDESNSYNK